MLMKLAPASVATALASRVLPVPGGPNNKTPLQGCRTCHQSSDSIRKISTLTISLNRLLVHDHIFSDMVCTCFLMLGNQGSDEQTN